MTELLIASPKKADELFKAGIALIEQGRLVNGHRVFVFEYGPGQSAIVRKIMNAKSR